MADQQKRWHHLSVVVPKALQQKSEDFFWNLGALSITEESGNGSEIFDKFTAQQEIWELIKLTALFDETIDVKMVLGDFQCEFEKLSSDITLDTFYDQAWHEKWLEQFKPIKINDDLWICPSWIKPPNQNAHNIFIDPGLAFGTGTHETTKNCLLMLSNLDLQNKSVIDYGCGSGILSIAAIKLGAKYVVANDIDEKALIVSRENSEKNDVSQSIELYLPDEFENLYKERNIKSDIVIANILSETLLLLKHEICSKVSDNGQLILSGILEHQSDIIINQYTQMLEGYNVSWTKFTDNNWVTLLADVKKIFE